MLPHHNLSILLWFLINKAVAMWMAACHFQNKHKGEKNFEGEGGFVYEHRGKGNNKRKQESDLTDENNNKGPVGMGSLEYNMLRGSVLVLF